MKRAAPWLSLCLPGLGQLSQRRFAWAGAFFLAFVFLFTRRWGWPWVPVVCLAAGAEALRFADGIYATDRLRRTYGVVAAFGLLCWVGLVSPVFLPLASQQQLNKDVERIRWTFIQCRVQEPASALQCLDGSEVAHLRDPWGRKYSWRLDEKGFVITSTGPDRQLGTPDDLAYTTPRREGEGW